MARSVQQLRVYLLLKTELPAQVLRGLEADLAKNHLAFGCAVVPYT
jgi:hypothetical protein